MEAATGHERNQRHSHGDGGKKNLSAPGAAAVVRGGLQSM